MKKTLCVCLAIFILALSGCAGTNIPPQSASPSISPSPSAAASATPIATATPAPLSVSDYFPIKENVKYTYEGQGNEYAAYTVYTDYTKDGRVQTRTNNGGSEAVKVLEVKDGQLTLLSTKGECYYRENFTGKDFSGGEALIKEPIANGTSWTLADGRKRTITKTDADVTTPAGAYKALEITTEGPNDKITDYYASGVGLVKSVFTSNGMEVTSSLSKIETDAQLTQKVKFYYPNIDLNKLYYTEKDLAFKTNDVTRTIFENAFKDVPSSNVGRVLSPEAKIQSMYLSSDNMVYVDFNKEFVTKMNAGSGYESMILQSITNTIGEYYGVSKVYITLDGEPYSSGHFMMKKGEAFTVNTQNSEQLK